VNRPFHLSLSVTGFLCLVLMGAGSLQAQDSAEEAEQKRQMELAQSLLGKTPDRAAILYFLAEQHALLQEPHEAIVNLKESLDLREGFDPAGDPIFSGLKSSPDFQKLVEQAHHDFPEVSHAKLAFVTKEKDLIPEGLAYDPTQDRLLLSSLHLKKIVGIPLQPSGQIKDFVPNDRYNLLPVLGIRFDPSDATIWAASWIENGKTELLHFAKDGSLLGRYSPQETGKHGFNDLIALRNGTLFITDTPGNQIYRFDTKSKAFQVIPASRPLLMPNGITVSENGEEIYFADQFGIFRLNSRTGSCIELKPETHTTISGVDGLYWHHGALIAVQNGIGSPRIAVFQLSKEGSEVKKITILEYRSSFSTLPTTGAIVGDDFYFIVNSQLDNLNGDRILDPTRLEPVRIGVLSLR